MNSEQQPVNIHFEETAAPPPAPAPEARTPHTDWDAVITGYREVLIKARAKATGQSPVTDPIPGVTMDLGTDKYGNISVPKLRGRYAIDEKTKEPRYALDRFVRLSLGKRHGRLRPHWNKARLALKSLSIETFRAEYQAHEDHLRMAATTVGQEFAGVPQDQLVKLAAHATKTAVREFRRRRFAARAARRTRQSVARRINFGIIPGNVDRRAHAEG